MRKEAINDNGMFAVEGPDEVGDVWLIFPDGEVESPVNLGPTAKVADALRSWLDALPAAGPVRSTGRGG